MTRHSSPIDHRPFQPRAKLENQQALVARYGAIAIPEVADALLHMRVADPEVSGHGAGRVGFLQRIISTTLRRQG